MAMIVASLATPVEPDPLPAAIPATCVPWLQIPAQGAAAPVPSWVDCPFGHSEVELLSAEVVEKHASLTTLLANNG